MSIHGQSHHSPQFIHAFSPHILHFLCGFVHIDKTLYSSILDMTVCMVIFGSLFCMLCYQYVGEMMNLRTSKSDFLSVMLLDITVVGNLGIW